MITLPTVLAVLLTTTSNAAPVDPALAEADAREAKRASLANQADDARVAAERMKLEATGLITSGVALPLATIAVGAVSLGIGEAQRAGIFGPPPPSPTLAHSFGSAFIVAGVASTCVFTPLTVLFGMDRLDDAKHAQGVANASERALEKLAAE